MRDVFIDGRVAINPLPLAMGRRATVKYQGLLAQSGAQKVFMHMGYGQDWRNTDDLPMAYIGGQCWETELMVNGDDTLNFCFHDVGDNWDNNSGMNWTMEIR